MSGSFRLTSMTGWPYRTTIGAPAQGRWLAGRLAPERFYASGPSASADGMSQIFSMYSATARSELK